MVSQPTINPRDAPASVELSLALPAELLMSHQLVILPRQYTYHNLCTSHGTTHSGGSPKITWDGGFHHGATHRSTPADPAACCSSPMPFLGLPAGSLGRYQVVGLWAAGSSDRDVMVFIGCCLPRHWSPPWWLHCRMLIR